MAYIYKITNKLNGKVYIGKTLLTPEKRFKQHLRDAKKKCQEQRPLYNAINHYGIDNFELSTVEECSAEIVNSREKYWIEYYNSYSNGYNATIGGDGKSYLDYDLIVNTYLKCLNQRETAKILKIDAHSVQVALKEKNIDYLDRNEVMAQKYGKKVNCYSLSGDLLKTFESLGAAAREMQDQGFAQGAICGVASHIRDAANGKRKSAYKHKWEFI